MCWNLEFNIQFASIHLISVNLCLFSKFVVMWRAYFELDSIQIYDESDGKQKYWLKDRKLMTILTQSKIDY